eukprot:scaffold113449_cov51-Attheya_sp.AAC.5
MTAPRLEMRMDCNGTIALIPRQKSESPPKVANEGYPLFIPFVAYHPLEHARERETHGCRLIGCRATVVSSLSCVTRKVTGEAGSGRCCFVLAPASSEFAR